MILTIDVGGTKTLIADFTKGGKLGRETKFPTPRDTDDFFEQLNIVLHETYGSMNKFSAVCIALPGFIERDAVLVYAPNLGWRNVDIAQRLSGIFSCPIYVQNDANLAALGEIHALESLPELGLYVTVSTGIGTGVVINGRLHPSLNKSESGHMVLEYDGRMREWEHFASGKSIRETYGKFAYEITSANTWKHIADKISRGFDVLIPVLRPDVIVIGGSIGTHFDKYAGHLELILKERITKYSKIPVPEIRQAQHPEQSVIYGCYYYVTHQLFA